MSASKQGFILVANDNRVNWNNPKLSDLQTAQILNTNHATVKHDLAFVTIALLKKNEDNAPIIDHFIKRLIEYREYCTMSPTDYDAKSLLGNVVAHLCEINSRDTIDECFDKMTDKADALHVKNLDELTAFDVHIICAKNTSNQIRQFINHHNKVLSQKQFDDALVGHSSASRIFQAINSYVAHYIDTHKVVSIQHMAQDFVLANTNAKGRSRQFAIAKECPILRLDAFRPAG